MTPEQHAATKVLLLQHLIRAFMAGAYIGLKYPAAASEVLESDAEAVSAEFGRQLSPSIDAILRELETLGVTP